MTCARAGHSKVKTPLPGEGSGVRIIINSWRRETTPGSFTTSANAKLSRLSAPGKRDGNALREPLR
jgi:predicted carbohydrate-binding protein with CBM5 and CBM33 domain